MTDARYDTPEAHFSTVDTGDIDSTHLMTGIVDMERLVLAMRAAWGIPESVAHVLASEPNDVFAMIGRVHLLQEVRRTVELGLSERTVRQAYLNDGADLLARIHGRQP